MSELATTEAVLVVVRVVVNLWIFLVFNIYLVGVVLFLSCKNHACLVRHGTYPEQCDVNVTNGVMRNCRHSGICRLTLKFDVILLLKGDTYSCIHSGHDPIP